MKINRKRIFWTCIAVVMTAALALWGKQIVHYVSNSAVSFTARDDYFYIDKNGDKSPFFLKGVNMGAAKAGNFPGEMMITKDDYKRWFRQIADMNANCIRVYTILSPDFYTALFEYNLNSNNPLYLLQGIWIDEENISKYGQAYAPEIMAQVESESKNIVDVLHGRITIPESTGHASGTYRFDVSPYVIGYILGIELDADFVIKTNTDNPYKHIFEGEYLQTAEDASPHEAFLAWMGETLIRYEQEKYETQKCVSFTNWITTDPLTHTNEPDPKEDSVSVDMEHIQPTPNYTAGLFASYHIYPYYPELMSYQPEYAEYTDSRGKKNPYLAYLLDLKQHHTMPVLAAEFGLPTSRGTSHENAVTGYNQGHLSELEQGLYAADMMQDISQANLAGGLIFTWQDEWFKRSWNTMDFDIPERRAYWSNYQVSEQSYGLLSFDPGKNGDRQVDGDLKEWAKREPVSAAQSAQLHIQHDEKFVYLLIRDSNMDADTTYIIGADTLRGQGNTSYSAMGVDFSSQADFAIVIADENNSSIRVDPYYDSFMKFYTLVGILEEGDVYQGIKDSGTFNPMRLCISAAFDLPLGGHVPANIVETGKLRKGNSNPESAEYDSLADYYRDDEEGVIEVRIPWQLLNFTDPSAKQVMADFSRDERWDLNSTTVDDIAFELHVKTENGVDSGESGIYTWQAWEIPAYHERLKQSYYILQECFSNY